MKRDLRCVITRPTAIDCAACDIPCDYAHMENPFRLLTLAPNPANVMQRIALLEHTPTGRTYVIEVR